MIFLEQKGGMEGKALYNINNFFAYFCKDNERVSCMYGVEREGLMMMMMMMIMMRVKIDLAICFYMP